jgi:dihydroorotate dehydrogenase
MTITDIIKKIDIWKHLDRIVDPYPFIRPLLFLLDPEYAHEMTLKMLSLKLGPNFHGPDDEILRTNVCGLDFPNPIHLAAGLDKQAALMDEFMGFGFGSIEVGTVTPKPQSGNPRPRMFRIAHAKALINRFGFNSIGVDAFVENLKIWRAKEDHTPNPVGVNIGKNKDTTEDSTDYVAGFEKVAPWADYVTINVASPRPSCFRQDCA